jgi:hypothetical protein
VSERFEYGDPKGGATRAAGGTVVVILLLFVAGCGQSPSTGSDPGVQPGTRTEAIAFGEALAQIRGHHLVSLMLYRAGDQKGAAVHAGHPIAEILASVRGELDEQGGSLGADLEDALQAGASAVADRRPPEELARIYERAASVTHRAEEAVVDGSEDPAYGGSVVAALLTTAGHEYEEAVGKSGVRLVVEYQDAYAFVREAVRLYRDIEADVRSAAPEEADEIEEAFDRLRGAVSSPRPPADPVDVLDVESSAELIGHELEETVGAVPGVVSDPNDVAAEIEDLLDEVIESYEAGDAAAAAELSAEAYLENYEVIEAEVIDKAPEINNELEPLLGAELRRRIDEGAPVSEIRQMVARAKELLSQAIEQLEEGH